jgi:hypothetical protein
LDKINLVWWLNNCLFTSDFPSRLAEALHDRELGLGACRGAQDVHQEGMALHWQGAGEGGCFSSISSMAKKNDEQ